MGNRLLLKWGLPKNTSNQVRVSVNITAFVAPYLILRYPILFRYVVRVPCASPFVTEHSMVSSKQDVNIRTFHRTSYSPPRSDVESPTNDHTPYPSVRPIYPF